MKFKPLTSEEGLELLTKILNKSVTLNTYVIELDKSGISTQKNLKEKSIWLYNLEDS